MDLAEKKMSLYDYRESIKISMHDYGFYPLIMAAMRKADSNNIEKLKSVFPDVWTELVARSSAPGGLLDEEVKMGVK